jgi:O-acetylhomoserine (thiol)-lyase
LAGTPADPLEVTIPGSCGLMRSFASGAGSVAKGLTTTVLHADRQSDIEHGAVHKPMHAAVAYGYRSSRELAAVFQGDKPGHVYGRQGNPTTSALEAKVSLMEQAAGTVCFSTGMAATVRDDRAAAQGRSRGSSQFLFGNQQPLQTLAAIGVEVTLADATDVAAVAAALRPATRLVFVETIANPATQVADLAAIGELCAARGVLYVVDNTMTSPWLFQPRTVKASLVINSLTKAIGGHGNALGGAVSDTGLYDWTAYPHIAPAYKKGKPATWGLLQIRKKGLRDLGATLSAEHAHRIAIGAETLALRMDRACGNALLLAHWLETQPGVARVAYPGLASHPQHGLPASGSATSARCSASSCARASTASTSLTRSSWSSSPATWAIPARWRSRSPTPSSSRWARRSAPRWASANR